MRKSFKRNVFTAVATMSMLTSLVAGCSCGKNQVETLEVETGTLQRDFVVGDSVEDLLANLKVVVKFSDGSTKTLTKDDVEVTLGEFTTQRAGTYPVKIKYNGKEITVTLRVVNDATDLSTIVLFSEPQSISDRKNAMKEKDNKEEEFFDRDNEYVVGDDNAFKFLPKVGFDEEETDTVGYLSAYKSVSTIKLVNSNGTKTDLTAEVSSTDGTKSFKDSSNTVMVVVDETKSTYDFTDAAVDSKFELSVRPDCDIYTCYPTVGSVTTTFVVRDGYNVTNAKELLLMANDIQDAWSGEQNAGYLSSIDAFLTSNNITKPTGGIHSLVLQNNISISDSDLPESFLDDTNHLDDYLDIYNRKLAAGETFSIYGNYFTLDASNITKVNTETAEDHVSHSSLMKVYSEGNGSAFNVYDLKNLGNGHRENNSNGFGGLIFVKSQTLTTTFNNNIIRSYYINNYAERRHAELGPTATLNLLNVKSYDPYQNFVFSWGADVINMSNCEFKRAGGPGMILQHVYENDSNYNYHIPATTMESVDIDNPLTGEEAWFTTLPGISTIVTYLKSLSTAINQYAAGVQKVAKFVDADGLMNILTVNMSRGMSVTGDGAQGSVTIDGQTIASMMTRTAYAVKDGKVTINGITYTYDANNSKLTNAYHPINSVVVDHETQNLVVLNGRNYALQSMGPMTVLADITDKLENDGAITDAYVVYDYDAPDGYELHKVSYAIASAIHPQTKEEITIGGKVVKLLIDNPVEVLLGGDANVIAILDYTEPSTAAEIVTGTFYSTSNATLMEDIQKYGAYVANGSSWEGIDEENRLAAFTAFAYFSMLSDTDNDPDTDLERVYSLHTGDPSNPLFAGTELGDKIAFIDTVNGINGVDYEVNFDATDPDHPFVSGLTDKTTEYTITNEVVTIGGKNYTVSTTATSNVATSEGFALYKELKQNTHNDIPVLESSAGGLAYFNGTELIVLDNKFYEGDYITLYYTGLAVVLKYYH